MFTKLQGLNRTTKLSKTTNFFVWLLSVFPLPLMPSATLLLAAAKAKLSYIKLLKHSYLCSIQSPFEARARYWISVSNWQNFIGEGRRKKPHYNYGNLDSWWQVRWPESLLFFLTVLESCAVWCAQYQLHSPLAVPPNVPHQLFHPCWLFCSFSMFCVSVFYSFSNISPQPGMRQDTLFPLISNWFQCKLDTQTEIRFSSTFHECGFSYFQKAKLQRTENEKK